MEPPITGDDWYGIGDEPLPVDAALRWTVRDDCGAEVLFAGTVRDHADGRDGVTALEYEAYVEQVVPKLRGIGDEARQRWPGLGRIAMLHRTGRLGLGETAVVVAVSAPHRPEAFAAARFCIDTLKAAVPIWKKETWDGGDGWGTDARPIDARTSESAALPRGSRAVR